MSTRNIHPHRRRGIVLLLAAIAAATGVTDVGAQASLGVPYIGNNHVSFYSTELTSDGVGVGSSKLYGGRYGHRFGGEASTHRFSILVQVAAKDYEAVSDGVYDVSLSAAMSRTLDDIDSALEVAASIGAEVKAWGFDPGDTGLARFSLPLTVGASYDLHLGAITLAPFVAPGGAYTLARRYVDDVRVMEDNAWDLRLTTGVSARLKEAVFTTSHIRGERGLPQSSRWTFAAGISF
jgi:hypothetical protein